jgi:hypothetical protein
MISSILTFIVVGFIAIVVLGVAMSIIGGLIGLASLLLFKVAPLLLVGYVVVRLLRPKPKQISDEDRKWLEG